MHICIYDVTVAQKNERMVMLMKMKRTLTLLISMVMLLSAVATTGFAEKHIRQRFIKLGIDSNTVWKSLTIIQTLPVILQVQV